MNHHRHVWSAILLAVLAIAGGASEASDFPVADEVIVEKGERKLHLMKNGRAFRTFDIALGIAPEGDKEQEGDFKTPEGSLLAGWAEPGQRLFPVHTHFLPRRRGSPRRQRPKASTPGGQIMIHGQPNEPSYSAGYYKTTDWTNGCIAVSNSDMIDIWLMTPDDVPIEIRP